MGYLQSRTGCIRRVSRSSHPFPANAESVRPGVGWFGTNPPSSTIRMINEAFRHSKLVLHETPGRTGPDDGPGADGKGFQRAHPKKGRLLYGGRPLQFLLSPVMTGRLRQENLPLLMPQEQQPGPGSGTGARTLQSPRLREGLRWVKESKRHRSAPGERGVSLSSRVNAGDTVTESLPRCNFFLNHCIGK